MPPFPARPSGSDVTVPSGDCRPIEGCNSGAAARPVRGYRLVMQFGVLGRLEIRRSDGAAVSIAGPARRQVLAALLARAGASVTAATLIDDLWGTDIPRSGLGTLRSHVAR